MTTTSEKPATTTSKGEATKQRILEAARRQLMERGYEGFALREVAAEAGMKLGNLQYHFPTRDVLLQAVFLEQAEADRAPIDAVVANPNDPETVLRLLVEDLTTRWRSEAAPICLTMASLALRDPAYGALYQSIYQDHYRSLSAAIAALKPGLPEAEYEMRARILTAMLDGAPFQMRAHPDQSAFLERLAKQAYAIALAP